jgi:hypothetical protein
MSKMIVPNMGEITEKAQDEQSNKSLPMSVRRIPKLSKNYEKTENSRRYEKTEEEICIINRILSKKMKHKI